MVKRAVKVWGWAEEGVASREKTTADTSLRRYPPALLPKEDYLTALTIASNAFGSFIARSASTFRLRLIPLALSLPMNCE